MSNACSLRCSESSSRRKAAGPSPIGVFCPNMFAKSDSYTIFGNLIGMESNYSASSNM